MMAISKILILTRRCALVAVTAWAPFQFALAQPLPLHPLPGPPAAGTLPAADERIGAWQSLSPEQRVQLWQSLSPEQRAALLERVGPGAGWQSLDPGERERTWRHLSPEQKAEIRGRMTPEQREALRKRFLEEHDRRMAQDPNCCGPRGAQHRRLSPEERQRLRDQVREANHGYAPVGPGGPARQPPRP